MLRTLQLIFIFLIVTLLFLPFFVYLSEPAKTVSVSENRKFASLPALTPITYFNKEVRGEFEEYWNDHFGLRTKLISYHSFISRKIFNKTPFRKVILGKQGWLFFNTPSITADLLQSPPLTELQLNSWMTTLEKREQWMMSRGIRYVVLPIPNKSHVYTEYLPAKYHLFRSASTQSNLEQLLEYLQENSSFANIVDLRPAFLKVRHERQLYFKTDTHWTWEGAHIAYTRLNEMLKNWFPQRKNVGYEDLHFREIRKRGDLASLASIRPYEERSLAVEVKAECTIQRFNLPNHPKGATKRHPIVTLCDSARNTAVVTYDSFGSHLEPYYSSQFRKVTYVSRHDAGWLMTYLDKERPDVFIHQRVERNLPVILQSEWGHGDEVNIKE